MVHCSKSQVFRPNYATEIKTSGAGWAAQAEQSVVLGRLTPKLQPNAERVCAIAKKEQVCTRLEHFEHIMGGIHMAYIYLYLQDIAQAKIAIKTS
eukprot:SAG11_NODE_229_length_11945_cov_77.865187_6_plen_95_part_00